MNYISVPKGLLPRVSLNAYSDAGEQAKTAFHRAGKSFLRKVAEALGLEPSQYALRNNLAGVAVSGEVTLHTDDLYIQLSESCMSRGVQVLYRSCSSRKDCCGGANHFASMQDLVEEYRQERFLHDLLALIENERARKSAVAIPA